MGKVGLRESLDCHDKTYSGWEELWICLEKMRMGKEFQNPSTKWWWFDDVFLTCHGTIPDVNKRKQQRNKSQFNLADLKKTII